MTTWQFFSRDLQFKVSIQSGQHIRHMPSIILSGGARTLAHPAALVKCLANHSAAEWSHQNNMMMQFVSDSGGRRYCNRIWLYVCLSMTVSRFLRVRFSSNFNTVNMEIPKINQIWIRSGCYDVISDLAFSALANFDHRVSYHREISQIIAIGSVCLSVCLCVHRCFSASTNPMAF